VGEGKHGDGEHWCGCGCGYGKDGKGEHEDGVKNVWVSMVSTGVGIEMGNIVVGMMSMGNGSMVVRVENMGVVSHLCRDVVCIFCNSSLPMADSN